jgi:hypothetical protein
MGLPYVNDAAVTRHLATFLKRHRAEAATGVQAEAPDAILFNGGVFQPATLRERFVEVMRHWFDAPAHPWQPIVLENPSLDLAVAWGAAYYSWLRHTGGRRIGGGIARSYYVAVGAGDGKVDEAPKSLSVVCVVPQRLEEGQEVVLDKPHLELALGQPVSFPLYTSTVRSDDRPGDLLQVVPEQLLQLPPLHTILRGGKRAGVKNVPVTLAAKSTEIGTLELYCVARDGGNRWRLEFNVRDLVRPTDGETADGPAGKTAVTDIWLETQVEAAAAAIRGCYTGNAPSPQELPRALEAALEATRHEWPTGLCRRLWDFLGEVVEQRRRSPGHLSRWYNLVGYCLRPGFGDTLDRYRVEQLWKFMHAPPKVEAGKPTMRVQEGGADYWIMWRRLSGGLAGPLQTALFDRIKGALLPGKGKSLVKPNPNELAEMWRTAASLERLSLSNKEALAQALLKSVKRGPTPNYTFWALTRLGARRLVYGPLNMVVHPEVVAGWLDVLLAAPPEAESDRLPWAFCLAELTRRTGQRALEVDAAHQDQVLAALRGATAPPHWIEMVEKVVEVEGEEQGQLLGDSLPIGLRLVQTGE